MKALLVLIFLLFTSKSYVFAQEAKPISDCTITYDLTVNDAKGDTAIIRAMSSSTKFIYIKGSKSRNDLIAPGFILTTLNDDKSDTTIILREIGNAKYITYLSGEKKKQQNKKFEGIQFLNTDEKKTILGYECKKVVAKLSNGSSYNVFFAPSVIATSTFEIEFKNLPGLVLEYEAESEDKKTRITYIASKITLMPVPEAKFNLPKSGYRVL